MKKGCEEIGQQGQDLRYSRKLRKVVAVYKTSELVHAKKYMSLKTRSLEKVPYSKSSYSGLIVCNQLINTLCFWYHLEQL